MKQVYFYDNMTYQEGGILTYSILILLLLFVIIFCLFILPNKEIKLDDGTIMEYKQFSLIEKIICRVIPVLLCSFVIVMLSIQLVSNMKFIRTVEACNYSKAEGILTIMTYDEYYIKGDDKIKYRCQFKIGDVIINAYNDFSEEMFVWFNTNPYVTLCYTNLGKTEIILFIETPIN